MSYMPPVSQIAEQARCLSATMLAVYAGFVNERDERAHASCGHVAPGLLTGGASLQKGQ